MKHFDVLVIGGGHAGCEAALAAARIGCRTGLLTMNPARIAEMSCNPSIGGVGKGQLVKEIDALGGEMGINADHSAIQFKRLNTRKGSAVHSSRCQSDKRRYAERMQQVIGAQPRLTVRTGEVKRLLVENGQIQGVECLGADGLETLSARQVVITAGTFMKAVMHCGTTVSEGGRFGEAPSRGLSDDLRELGFPILRLKTGTPPRLKAASLDFTAMERQDGDVPPRRFSFSPTEVLLPQQPCFLTYTNSGTHAVIRENLARSPLYSGQIKGIGPRYCPSLEDKVVKFPDKDRHPLFFEPEALDSDWIYPNGISTSLPPDVQEAFLRTLPGCAHAEIVRYGYAVEYDCIDPRQLTHTLESRHIGGLFLAGQVNGTSGYEEAAVQGLLAGINAACRALQRPSLVLARSEAYAGVLVDDLVTLGVTEPYRMFTSRAEYRLSLREDNADLRLRPYGRALGLVDDAEFARFEARRLSLESTRAWMSRTIVKPTAEVQARLADVGSAPLATAQPVAQLLRRPELTFANVRYVVGSERFPARLAPESEETLDIEVKYEGYISLQKEEIARLHRMKRLRIPSPFDYGRVVGLTVEIREKLSHSRPETLADAALLSGVTPAALSALLFHLQQGKQAPGSGHDTTAMV